MFTEISKPNLYYTFIKFETALNTRNILMHFLSAHHYYYYFFDIVLYTLLFEINSTYMSVFSRSAGWNSQMVAERLWIN